MNTKQVEELTGITRQNIRYYERQGLLEPARETGNSYRDYSEEDIRRLKLIKMLRMLDVPLKEIEEVLNGRCSLKEVIAKQQENLLKQQSQLKAALGVCANIQKDKAESIDVDQYLTHMEHLERSGGLFARIVDDYKQVVKEERQRRVIFYTEETVNTAGTFEKVLQDYAKGNQMKFRLIKPGMYPEFSLDGVVYTATRILEKEPEMRSRIICSRTEGNPGQNEIPKNRRAVLQGIHLIGVNIRKHRVKSILNVAVSLMTMLVLIFYLGNLIRTEQQFQELPEKIPVRVTVMNANGELERGLFIRQQILDLVYGSSNTKDIKETGELIGSIYQDRAGGDAAEFPVLGVSIPECIDEFCEGDITWANGWNWEKFLSSEDVCIADETFLKNRGMTAGDLFETFLERYKIADLGISLEREQMGTRKLKIVGTGSFSQIETVVVPDVVVPLDTVKQIYKENDKVYFASSLAFLVKDPIHLNDLKKELRELHMQQVVPEAQRDHAGSAIRIEDNVFIQTAVGLEKNLSLLQGFLPFIFLVVILAGYIVPHLLFQGRRSEYAVMRALGTSRMRCTVLFFIEHILLAVLGVFIGAVIGIGFGAIGIGSAAVTGGAFLTCYMLGAAAAMWTFGRMSVAAVLSRRD